MCLRDKLGVIYSDKQFANLFKLGGQLAYSPGQLALVMIFQHWEGLSDREAAQAVRARIDWKYALGLGSQGFDHTVWSDFRGRLTAGGADQHPSERCRQPLPIQGGTGRASVPPAANTQSVTGKALNCKQMEALLAALARQCVAVVCAAGAYWLLPSRWRSHALLPISLLVLLFGYERWPMLLIGFALVALIVHGVTPMLKQRFGNVRVIIIALTVLYVGLHAVLGILTYTSWLEWTGIPLSTAIEQCGMPVMFGFLKLWHFAADHDRPVVENTAPTRIQFLNWLFFFPLFMRLPLVRHPDFLPMRSERLEPAHVRRALKHACQWAGKLALAAGLAQIPFIGAIWQPGSDSWAQVWLAVVLTVIQFFLGFSAIVDFAIASAALMGFMAPDNFARIDTLLTNVRVRDFWRDWNYSVTRWLQDYIYTPLGGFRRHPLRNTMLTMLFCGLWHSFSPLGALWGLLMGGLMLGEHVWSRIRIQQFKKLPNLPAWVRAPFWLLCFALVQVVQIPFSYTSDGPQRLIALFSRLAGL